MSIDNTEVLNLVARLVVGYLDEQNLTNAYNSFCETSRHLSQDEYIAFTQGVKTIDTSIGLVNIITEYFLIKDKLNEFIRLCPKTSLIIKLIDTSSFLLRLELIFKVLKENLQIVDKSEVRESRKRKLDEDPQFDISNTNTSTPETAAQCSKRRRVSFSKTLITLSSNRSERKEKVIDVDQIAQSKKELVYISSPDTSNKEEDDVTDEYGNSSVLNSVKPLPPELLSETVLRKTDFVENLAEIINQTRSAKENDKSLETSGSPKSLTENDFQDIISKTENDFEDILNEVIDKYLEDNPTTSAENEASPSQTKEEVPIKQRLRPRIIKRKPSSEDKKKKTKIKILSNEVINPPLSIPSTSLSTVASAPILPPAIENQSVVFNLVPIVQQIPTTTTFIPWQSFHPPQNIEIPQNVQIILSEKKQLPNENEMEKPKEQQQTPKVPIPAKLLESKCKSTPRRKATHIRILDFNQTPSANRLSTIKEFRTPSNGIRLETPGSAPASINISQKFKEAAPPAKNDDILENSLEIIDESSNSNSISNTPKVSKNRRRRKIEIDSKTSQEKEESPKPMTREEWEKMRAEQKTLSVDERMRLLFQKEHDKQECNVKKRKTPKKKDVKKSPISKLKKKFSSANLVGQQGKKLSAKFKVTSPRKAAALLRKTPKKKKISNQQDSIVEIFAPKNVPKAEENDKVIHSVPKLSLIDTPVKENKEIETNDLNRSDTVQEVANLLTHLPETILAKTSKSSELVDTNILLETPLKLDSVSPLPNTPRFAVPLVSIHQETPLSKVIINPITTNAATSMLKVCDILTPSFPITPGFKETPPKSDVASPSLSTGGYSSRRTDYSSCSSYYKPDESEDINQNLEMMIKHRRGSERNSQSESDQGPPKKVKNQIKIGSARKVDCPGALERMMVISESLDHIITPHYTMMDEEALLSESMITTASSDESSSSFTCSTCSTDPSSDEDTINLLNKSIPEDRDSEWQCDDPEVQKDLTSNNSLINQSGELRFPLRNLITPKKVEPIVVPVVAVEEESKQVPKIVVEEEKKPEEVVQQQPIEVIQKVEEKKIPQMMPDLEAIKRRTLKKIKDDSKKCLPKMRKSNSKFFKLPPEQPKLIPLTRRDQILQQNLSERPRPTPLKLISSSSSSSSSSRRKNATPRKTIIIEELPKVPSPIKKTKKCKEKKKVDAAIVKTPIKPERVSLENITDNAVSIDDHPSLNISTSFQESSEDEVTVVDKTSIKNDDGSNTFQRSLIAQGFDKNDAKELQTKLVDEIHDDDEDQKKKEEQVIVKTNVNLSMTSSESEEGESDDDEEEECEHAFSNDLDKNTFSFDEPPNFKAKELTPIKSLCAPSKIQIDGKTVKIDFCELTEIFSMEPATKKSKNNNDEKSTEKENIKSSTESKILPKEIEIDKILTLIHGKD